MCFKPMSPYILKLRPVETKIWLLGIFIFIPNQERLQRSSCPTDAICLETVFGIWSCEIPRDGGVFDDIPFNNHFLGLAV